MPWQGYLLIGFLVLFVGFFVLIFLYAFLEGWWLSRQSIPVRFDTLEKESDFDKSVLSAIAKQLGMIQVDRIPGPISEEILNGMRGDWKGLKPTKMPSNKRKLLNPALGGLEGADFRNLLIRKQRDGVFLICNVSRAKQIVVEDSSGERETKRYVEADSITITAFWQTEKLDLPEFTTRPFIDSLLLKLCKLLGRTWFGHPRFKDDQEFHDKVLISAAEPEKVRPVLTDGVRNVLKENCDLTTVIQDHTIVVYSEGHPVRHMIRKGPEDGEIVENCKILKAEEWPRLFKAAESIMISILQP